jgi:hypothetical protein
MTKTQYIQLINRLELKHATILNKANSFRSDGAKQDADYIQTKADFLADIIQIIKDADKENL